MTPHASPIARQTFFPFGEAKRLLVKKAKPMFCTGTEVFRAHPRS